MVVMINDGVDAMAVVSDDEVENDVVYDDADVDAVAVIAVVHDVAVFASRLQRRRRVGQP